jgi:GNAT superfamily N-acetyltransferase
VISPEISIRPLVSSDSIDELTELVRAAYQPHLANGLRFVGTYQTSDITAKRCASGYGLVAIGGERLVGTVLVRPPQPTSKALLYRDPSTWSLSQLAVHPDFKGRGVARALHDAAVELALSHGAQVIALDTAEPAKELIELYQRWGYQIVGSVDWRPHTNYESVLMARTCEPSAISQALGADDAILERYALKADVSLRPATLDDAHSVAEVLIESRAEYLPFAPSVHAPDEVRAWVAAELIPTGDVTVAEHRGLVVGVLATSRTGCVSWIDQMYVRPGWAAQGVGPRLLAHAHRLLPRPIRLYPFQENVRARRFYERHGYMAIKLTDGLASQERCPDVLYELS